MLAFDMQISATSLLIGRRLSYSDVRANCMLRVKLVTSGSVVSEVTPDACHTCVVVSYAFCMNHR